MMRAGFQQLMQAIQDCEKPVIVALNGTAAGGGSMLVLAADLVIAANTAKLIQVFVRRGLVPDGGVAYLLPRIVGMHKAKELIFFGDDLSAADAETLGIVNKVVPAAELQAAAKEWAERLASRADQGDRLVEEAAARRVGAVAPRPARRRGDARRAQLARPSTPAKASRRSASAARPNGRAGERSATASTSDLIKDRTAVVGIGQTAFGKGLPDTELSLACQAISMALDDAGIAPSEVDGLASYTLEPNREVDVARSVGLGDITFFSQVGFGGGAGCGVVGQAAMAVATGQCTTAVAWRARKRADATSRPWAQAQARLVRHVSSGRGRSASSARSTRSRCSPAATCTSTARRASTSRTSRSRSASTRRATRRRRWATSR